MAASRMEALYLVCMFSISPWKESMVLATESRPYQF